MEFVDRKKFYKSKLIFDINLFPPPENGKEFIIIPLDPVTTGVEIHRNKFEQDPDSIKIQIDWLSNCGYFNTKEELENVLSKNHRVIASVVYPFLDRSGFDFSVLLYEHGFIMDDYYFEKDIFANKMNTFLEGKDSEQENFGELYRDIYKKYSNFGHPGNFKRIFDENKNWTTSSVFANTHGRYNAEMSFDDYCKVRFDEIGGGYASSIIMSCTDLYVPDEIYNSDVFKDLRYQFTYIGLFSNDLYSFKKEMNDPSFSNVVKVLAIEFGNVQKAIDKSFQLLIHYFKSFEKSSQKVFQTYPDNDAVKLCLQRFKILSFGTYYMHLLCSRYSNSDLLKLIKK